MKRAYFQYYETFENIVQKFSTADEREAMRTKIINYGLFGIEPEKLNDKEEMVWDVIRDLIDDQRHRREINAENRRAKTAKFIEENETKQNEKKETEGKKENETTEKEIKSPSSELNRNEVERNEKKRNEVNSTQETPATHTKRFIKPTLDEIKAYCQERQNTVNAERFFDFYESKGWKVGNNSMKDWKAAVRTWEQKNETPHYSPTFQRQQQLPDDRLTF